MDKSTASADAHVLGDCVTHHSLPVVSLYVGRGVMSEIFTETNPNGPTNECHVIAKNGKKMDKSATAR